MKKKILIAGAMISSMAAAVPPNIGPPITSGAGANSSTTEVRITANVVEGIAVNEASPIDFGNLARGVHPANSTVNQNTPGRITLKGTASDNINLKLNTTKTDLTWTGSNGTNDTTSADLEIINDVNIHGLGTSDTAVQLDSNGELSRILTATIKVGGAADSGNLMSKQKLGSYVGSVIVTATKQ